MNKLNAFAARFHNPDVASLLLRLALGAVFVNAGWMKVQMMDMVLGGFAQMGIPAFLAYFVTYFELVGGALLILGVLSRYVGVVLAVIMAVAIWKAHWANGFSAANNGYEYLLVLGLSALALAFIGSGKWSVDRWLSR